MAKHATIFLALNPAGGVSSIALTKSGARAQGKDRGTVAALVTFMLEGEARVGQELEGVYMKEAGQVELDFIVPKGGLTEELREPGHFTTVHKVAP